MLCPCTHFGHIYPIFYPQFPAAVTFLHSNYSDFIQNKQGLMWTSPILNQCEYFGHFTSKGRNLGIKMGHCQNLPCWCFRWSYKKCMQEFWIFFCQLPSTEGWSSWFFSFFNFPNKIPAYNFFKTTWWLENPTYYSTRPLKCRSNFRKAFLYPKSTKKTNECFYIIFRC